MKWKKLFSLKFNIQSEENSYINDYISKNLYISKMLYILVIALFCIFSVLDPYVAPTSYKSFWIIRYIFVIPIYVYLLIENYKKDINAVGHQKRIFIGGLTATLSIVAMITISSKGELAYDYYFAGLFLTIFGVYTCLKMSYLQSIISSWIGTTLYLVYLGLQTDFSTHEIFKFINHSVFFISANVLGMFASYSLESSNRQNFTLIKDIQAKNSELEKSLDIIHQTQNKLIESERLSTLGVLVGGISHNLKSQLMSISGCSTELKNLIAEYKESVENKMVTNEDHFEISNDMLQSVRDIDTYVGFIDKVISTLKTQLATSQKPDTNFNLSVIIDNITFLMKYEVKMRSCSLIVNNNVTEDIFIQGNSDILIQVINNLIINATQAYKKIDSETIDVSESRKIYLDINKKDDVLILSVKDFGCGISDDVKSNLFKSMVTTKGKDGTGIGLYTSYSKIKGMFNGHMHFTSDEGVGTTFYVEIPLQ